MAAEGESSSLADDQQQDVQDDISVSSLPHTNELPRTLPYNEIFHLGLASQPNVYCCSRVDAVGSAKEKLLVGSLSGKVSCVECVSQRRSSSAHQLHSNEVYFTYIPGDAEIVSIDTFIKRKMDAEEDHFRLIVGITLVKNPYGHGVGQKKQYLNVYSSTNPQKCPSLDKDRGLAESCMHIELQFIPYQLTHASIKSEGVDDTVFLLSGSDGRVHMFTEDRDQQKFVEKNTESHFPEFLDLPSNATWIDINRCHDNQRATAIACESGYVRFCVVDELTAAVLCSCDVNVDGPSLSVRLFELQSAAFSFHDLSSMDVNAVESWQNEAPPLCQTQSLNLLVTSALDMSVVFMSPRKSQFSDMSVLCQSDHYDAVTCSLICDVDCDGNNEIIIGTYGQELLFYKWRTQSGGSGVFFDLIWRCSFSQPIFALQQLDLFGDGMQELAVATMTSVHIMQRDASSSVSMLVEKLIKITSTKQ